MTDTVLPSYAYIAPDDAEHEINTPLARKVLEFLEDHQGQHAQGAWATLVDRTLDERRQIATRTTTIDQAAELALGACGTAGCFAGWTAVIEGHTVGTIGDWAGVVIDLSPDVEVTVETYGDVTDVWVDGPRVGASEYARDALGLTRLQAGELFAPGNSRADLRRMLSDWTNGEIEAVRPGA